MTPEEMQFRIVARATDLLYTESAFAERTCTIHQKDIGGRIGRRRDNDAADAVRGLAGAIGRLARRGKPAEGDGDGDGKYDADADGQDDDPYLGGVAGAVAGVAGAVARGARRVQEIREGDDGEEQDTLLGRGLRRMAEVVRPNEDSRAREATEDVARAVPKTPSRQRAAAAAKPGKPGTPSVDPQQRELEKLLSRFEDGFGPNNRRFTMRDTFTGLLDGVSAENFVEQLTEQARNGEQMTDWQERQLAGITEAVDQLNEDGALLRPELAQQVKKHLENNSLVIRLDRLDEAVKGGAQQGGNPHIAKFDKALAGGFNAFRAARPLSAAEFVDQMKNRIREGYKVTSRQQEQLDRIRKAMDDATEAAWDKTLPAGQADEIIEHINNHPVNAALNALREAENFDHDKMVEARAGVANVHNAIDQIDRPEELQPFLDLARREERRAENGSRLRDARAWVEVEQHAMERQNQIADAKNPKISKARDRKKNRAQPDLNRWMQSMQARRFNTGEGDVLDSENFMKNVIERLEDGRGVSDHELNLVKSIEDDTKFLQDQLLQQNLSTEAMNELGGYANRHGQLLAKVEEAKSTYARKEDKARAKFRDLSERVDNVTNRQGFKELNAEIDQLRNENSDDDFALNELKRISDKLFKNREQHSDVQGAAREAEHEARLRQVRQSAQADVADVERRISSLDQWRMNNGRFSDYELESVVSSAQRSLRNLMGARRDVRHGDYTDEERQQLYAELDGHIANVLAAAIYADTFAMWRDSEEIYDEWPEELDRIDAGSVAADAERTLKMVKAKRAAGEELTDDEHNRVDSLEKAIGWMDRVEKDMTHPEDRPDVISAEELGKAQRTMQAIKDVLKRPMPEEEVDQEALKAKTRGIAKDTVDRRRGILKRFIDDMHGGTPPWEGSPTVHELDSARRGNPQKVLDWQRKVFIHDEIVTRDGRRLRTRFNGYEDADGNWVEEGNRVGEVSGRIEMFDETDQTWKQVGKFARQINYGTESVHNSYMYIGRDAGAEFDNDFANSAKNSGFQSIFNPFAFQSYKAAGFDFVDVDAISDGPYVWGRVGFRPTHSGFYKNMAKAMETEVKNFRAGRRSIIENEEQAALISALIKETQNMTDDLIIANAPGTMEYSVIIDPGGGRQKVRDWFVKNAPFGSGVFKLGKMEAVT
jgi:hypothetical protein